MLALGYVPRIEASQLGAAFAEYSEDAPPIRPELAAYRWSPEREREERLRSASIEKREFARELFIFDRAFQALQSQRAAPR
jgi:hypothetical protein